MHKSTQSLGYRVKQDKLNEDQEMRKQVCDVTLATNIYFSKWWMVGT